MDDQNTTQPGAGATDPTGGAQPVSSDTSLPWMNFAPEAPAAGDSAGTPAAGGTSDATTPPAAGGFDPFGNPFASTGNADAVASAFAPSPVDGSMPAAEPAPFTPSEPTAFTPSEPSAFTATPEPVVETPAPETPAPASDTSLSWAAGSSSTATDGEDTLAILAGLKKKFDEEEEEFNQQIEEHNANIQFEKEAINKLRTERSDRLAEMRKIVHDLEDMLGIKKQSEHKPQEGRRTEETRKAERILSSKKPQQNDSGINDFLAA